MGEDFEVVVTGLPEGSLGEPFRDGELQGLQDFREQVFRRFAEEDVDVLRHDDIAEDSELVAAASEFERVEEDVF